VPSPTKGYLTELLQLPGHGGKSGFTGLAKLHDNGQGWDAILRLLLKLVDEAV
jgi:hypothetical protein